MKVVVVYMSQTGNTKKVAEAVFQEIQAKKDIKELKDVDSLKGYDFAFIGFPIHYGGPAKPAKNFLEKQVQGKKIALFVTHATREDSKALQKWLAKCKKAATGADLAGFFNCQGKLDTERLERARGFAKEVIRKIGPKH